MGKIKINNQIIGVKLSNTDDDYISLTDMARFKDKDRTGFIILKWLSTKYTIRFMGLWEQINNNDFNVTEFGNIKDESGTNDFMLSVSRWVFLTNAIGIKSSYGRYGGTFAHKDIAFEFAS